MKRSAFKTTIALIGAGMLVWAPATMAGDRAIYSDDGISELRAPGHWSVRADIGRNAALRVSDSMADFHLAVYTYLPEELEQTTLAKFAEDFSDDLKESLEDGRMSAPRTLTVNGRPAVQYEVAGRVGEDRFVYLSTTVEGKRAMHQLVATVAEADYPAHRGELDKAIRSFRESAKPRPAKERVDLVFDWPQRGESTFTMHNTKAGRNGTHEMQMRGVTTVRPLQGEGLLVSTRIDDFKLSPADPDAAKQNYLQNLLQQATSEVPDYVVSTEGEFLRFENLRAYYERIEQALLKGLPGGDADAQEAAKKLVKGLLSEETLMVAMQEGWSKQVENWAGGSYAVGEDYAFEAPYQMPALGDAVFPMHVNQKLTGRVPCHEKDEAASCVQLVQTSRVSGSAFDQAMQAYLNRLFKEAAGGKGAVPTIAVDGVEVVKTVTLVTDPDTLMPYQETESERKTTRISVNGQKQSGEETSETVTRYTH